MILPSLKQFIRNFSGSLRFYLSAKNHPLLLFYYRFLYRAPDKSLAAFIDSFSKLNSPGFFVFQVGANDGITHDPIHKFIKRDKWSGILLEPQQEVYEKKLAPIYEMDQEIITINAALAEENGSMELFEVAFSNERWASGLSTFNRTVLEKAMNNGTLEKLAQKYNANPPFEKGDWITSKKINTINVDTLLKKYQIEKIDLLQIDTEGFDFEIIQLFDLDHIRPTAIIYEQVHLSSKSRDYCRKHLEGKRYQLFSFEANCLAIDADFYQQESASLKLI